MPDGSRGRTLSRAHATPNRPRLTDHTPMMLSAAWLAVRILITYEVSQLDPIWFAFSEGKSPRHIHARRFNFAIRRRKQRALKRRLEVSPVIVRTNIVRAGPKLLVTARKRPTQSSRKLLAGGDAVVQDVKRTPRTTSTVLRSACALRLTIN